jgi:hypothetical protein
VTEQNDTLRRERKYGPMFNVLYDLSPWIPPGYFSVYGVAETCAQTLARQS